MLARLNLHPTPSEVNYFANTLAVLGIVFAVILAITGRLMSGLAVAGVCIALAVICRFIPIVGRWIYVVWMLVTFALTLIVSPIAIAFIYYVILTPISLFARLSQKDELRLRNKIDKTTCFDKADYDTSPDSFRRQF